MTTAAGERVVLAAIAQQAIELAMRTGATDAECTIAEGEEFGVSIRKGEVETVKEAGSRGGWDSRADREEDGIVVHVGFDRGRDSKDGGGRG